MPLHSLLWFQYFHGSKFYKQSAIAAVFKTEIPLDIVLVCSETIVWKHHKQKMDMDINTLFPKHNGCRFVDVPELNVTI